MNSSSCSDNLYQVEGAVDNLNALVFQVMGPLGFNENPQHWRQQLEEYFAAWYRTSARDGKKAIRAMAQRFVGTDRTDNLLQRGTDLVDRVNVLHGMLEALDIFQLETQESADLNNNSTALRDTLGVVVDKLSRWQRDLREWKGVFLSLEATHVTELLLFSIPVTVPEDYLIQGRDLIDQMVAFWTVRKDVVATANRQYDRFGLEDPKPFIERLDVQREALPQVVSSFADLIKQLDGLPPLRTPRHEYSARQFFEADKIFTRLSSQLTLIEQDMCRLERIFDRAASLAMEG